MNATSRTVIVTGANGAIGRAIARQLAKQPAWKICLVGRSEKKLQRTAEEIARLTNNPQISVGLVDLSRKSAIKNFATNWQGPLHVLINNAACTPRDRRETPEGIELQFATNVLGYYWMVDAFRDILRQSAPARVVNVASYWAGGLNIDDLEFRRKNYHNDEAYRQSKQANRMLTVLQAEMLRPDGISVNACHPGDVNSVLSNNLGFGGSQTPDDGAATPVWLATSEAVTEESGKYFERRRAVHCRFTEDCAAIEKLYQICKSY